MFATDVHFLKLLLSVKLIYIFNCMYIAIMCLCACVHACVCVCVVCVGAGQYTSTL